MAAAMDWTTVELATTIVCASFPTYGPLLALTSMLSEGLRSWYTSLIVSSRQTATLKGSCSGSAYDASDNRGPAVYGRLGGDIADTMYLTRAVGGTEATDHSSEPENYQMDKINVQRTVEVV